MIKKLAVACATWFGSGLLPPLSIPFIRPKEMAGTWGSIFSLPLCWWIAHFYWSDPWNGMAIYPWIVFTVALIGMWSVPIAEVALGPRRDYKGRTRYRDQNQIVIDETLGMLIACWPIAVIGRPHWPVVPFVVAFGLFRLFDIKKPWPANYFDRVESAAGVMLDDVFAALWAVPVVALVDYLLL